MRPVAVVLEQPGRRVQQTEGDLLQGHDVGARFYEPIDHLGEAGFETQVSDVPADDTHAGSLLEHQRRTEARKNPTPLPTTGVRRGGGFPARPEYGTPRTTSGEYILTVIS